MNTLEHLEGVLKIDPMLLDIQTPLWFVPFKLRKTCHCCPNETEVYSLPPLALQGMIGSAFRGAYQYRCIYILTPPCDVKWNRLSIGPRPSWIVMPSTTLRRPEL